MKLSTNIVQISFVSVLILGVSESIEEQKAVAEASTSTSDCCGPEKAIDGYLTTRFDPDRSTDPWLQIKLPVQIQINNVTLVNWINEDFKNIDVRAGSNSVHDEVEINKDCGAVSDDHVRKVSSYHFYDIICASSILADHIIIQLKNNGTLVINEIKINGKSITKIIDDTPPTTNDAINQDQTPTYVTAEITNDTTPTTNDATNQDQTPTTNDAINQDQTPTSVTDWPLHSGVPCRNGTGATNGKILDNVDLKTCIDSCAAVEGCEGVVRMKKDANGKGKCWHKHHIDLNVCGENDEKYDLYLKPQDSVSLQTEDTEEVATSTVSSLEDLNGTREEIRITDGPHNASASLEGTAVILCPTNVDFVICNITTPYTAIYEMQPGSTFEDGRITFPTTQFPEKNCGVKITNVTRQDFGVWICQVSGDQDGGLETAAGQANIYEKEEKQPTGKADSPLALLIGVFIVLLLVCIGIIFFIKRKQSQQKTKDAENPSKELVDLSEATIPRTILTKGKNLKNDSLKYMESSHVLKNEFKILEKFDDQVIKPALSFAVGKDEENKPHNRYRDMVPYDNTRIVLSSDVGTPATDYINASTITFPNLEQQFIAIQAPKENSFENFWQVVIDKQVSVIVMITGLKEGGRTKSHQYWPDFTEGNSEVTLNNAKILYQSHTFPGTYYHRKLLLTSGQTSREIHHIQTTAWLDMTAPKDSKILLDLVYKAQELAVDTPGPILVHCSAGVGRTGTFIALYKLAEEYTMDAVDSLDLVDTVISMRRQRMKMVQKAPQYAYIAKCLAHYISAQESDYS